MVSVGPHTCTSGTRVSFHCLAKLRQLPFSAHHQQPDRRWQRPPGLGEVAHEQVPLRGLQLQQRDHWRFGEVEQVGHRRQGGAIRREHSSRAAHDRREQLLQRGRERDGGEHQVPVLDVHVELRAGRHSKVGQSPVGDHHHLRRADGARGVDDTGKVFR